ncbi:hypothetical protein [Comamonas testosteroni]|uniref:hypothetical protein n=1 Tax=Comamonas testosteroni TaxID=285 RepID=UPI0026E94246|nr:hypothetical protein [Comamonas testosteroni]
MIKSKNYADDIELFSDAFVSELISMSDEDVLDGHSPDEIKSKGLKILQAAKLESGRRRMAIAKEQLEKQSKKSRESAAENVDVADARRYLSNASNDNRFTLAARNLAELSDEEVLRIFRQMQDLQRNDIGAKE